MAFDAPRKTLDDIRRELDAEYGASATLDAQKGRAAEDSTPGDALPDPEDEATIAALHERPSRWGGYIIAGLVGCIAGQVVILGTLALLGYSNGSAVRASTSSATDTPAERVAPSASVTSPPPAASEPPAAPPVPERTVVTPSATQSVPQATAPASSPEPPRASVRAVTTPAPAADEAKSPPRRAARPTPVAPAPAPSSAAPARSADPPATVADSHDWARSQDEVRAALSEWLAQSNQDTVDVRPSNTVVILGADGLTAKSHVPIRTAGGIVVHEQRWKREADGWRLVENREAWRSDVAR